MERMSGEKRGIARIIDSINRVADSVGELRTRLLIETTAGQGSVLGHRFEQIKYIIQKTQNVIRPTIKLRNRTYQNSK